MADVYDQIEAAKDVLSNGSNSEIAEVLHTLDTVPISIQILLNSGIGKIVNSLRHNPVVGSVAKALVTKWKQAAFEDAQQLTVPAVPVESQDSSKPDNHCKPIVNQAVPSPSSSSREEKVDLSKTKMSSSAPDRPTSSQNHSTAPKGGNCVTKSDISSKTHHSEKLKPTIPTKIANSQHSGESAKNCDSREKVGTSVVKSSDKDFRTHKGTANNSVSAKTSASTNVKLKTEAASAGKEERKKEAKLREAAIEKKSKPPVVKKLVEGDEGFTAQSGSFDAILGICDQVPSRVKPKSDKVRDKSDKKKHRDGKPNDASQSYHKRQSTSAFEQDDPLRKRTKLKLASEKHHSKHEKQKGKHDKNNLAQPKPSGKNDGGFSSWIREGQSGAAQAVSGLPDIPLDIEESKEDVLRTFTSGKINTQYVPRPLVEQAALMKGGLGNAKSSGEDDEDQDQWYRAKHSKTAVFAGSKRAYTQKDVPSLYDCCIKVLRENIDAIEYCGGIPYDILKPVLVRASALQLDRIENFNPNITSETDELWKLHCLRDFKGFKPDLDESWKELYLKETDEKERKLRSLTASISAKQKLSQAPVLKAKLADAKPPRDVRRAQTKFGTYGKEKKLPSSDAMIAHRRRIDESIGRQDAKSDNDNQESSVHQLSLKPAFRVAGNPEPEPPTNSKRSKSGRAPMMMKSMKMFKRVVR